MEHFKHLIHCLIFNSIHSTESCGRHLKRWNYFTPDAKEKGLYQQDCWQMVRICLLFDDPNHQQCLDKLHFIIGQIWYILSFSFYICYIWISFPSAFFLRRTWTVMCDFILLSVFVLRWYWSVIGTGLQASWPQTSVPAAGAWIWWMVWSTRLPLWALQ